MARIGLIGLGNMGSGMAANLAGAGHEVLAYDLNPQTIARAVEAGCQAAASVEAASQGAEVIVTMLPAGQHVRSVYGESVLRAADSNPILIDCSTIDIVSVKAVSEQAGERGLDFVDAPVSGGVAAAAAGTLTFMVGGSDQAFARARPILDAMGKTVVHAGGIGAGQAAKLCNNMLLAISMIGTAEAFTLAQKLGLDPQTFFDITSRATGQCWSVNSYCPVPGPVPTAPSNRDFEGGFATALMVKDLKLAMQAAIGADASVPLGSMAESLYQAFSGLGGAGKDFSAIIRMIDGSWQRPDA